MGAGQPAPGLPPGTSKIPRKTRREEQRRATGAQHLPHHLPPAARKRTRGGRVKESSWGEEGAKRALQKLQPFESSLSS